MRTRITTAALVLAAALVGCSSSNGDDKPAPTTTTVTATPKLSAEEARAECVAAWAATIGARPDDFNPETDSDPEPGACKGLPEDEWTDMYMEGLMQSNRDALEERAEEREAAASADAEEG